MQQKDKKEDRPEKRPAIEWIFGIVSGCLVLVLLIFLAYEALLGSTRPAVLSAITEGIERRDDATVVSIAVTNSGGEAASAVTIVATPTGTSANIEPRTIEFDYIAAGGVRRGAVVFSEPVTSLALDVGGYVDP